MGRFSTKPEPMASIVNLFTNFIGVRSSSSLEHGGETVPVPVPVPVPVHHLRLYNHHADASNDHADTRPPPTLRPLFGPKLVAFPCVVVVHQFDSAWFFSAVITNHIGLIGEGKSADEAVDRLQQCVRRRLSRDINDIDFASDPISFYDQLRDQFIKFVRINLVRNHAQNIRFKEGTIYL